MATPAVSVQGAEAVPLSNPGFPKSCLGAELEIVSEIVAVCVSVPEVPVTVIVVVPVVAVADAVKVKTEVALLLAGGVTGLVENAAVTPLGKPEALNVVAELKLFWLVTVIVLVPVAPWVTLSEAGAAARVKLGVVETPVPDKLAVCGLPVALSVSVIVPVRVPAAVGVNVTLMEQLAPAASEVPQVLVWA